MVSMMLTGFFSAGVEGVGGTYRYGHIRWTSEGNTVTFTLEVAYKRNITDMSYWKGTAPDLLPQVRDSRISSPWETQPDSSETREQLTSAPPHPHPHPQPTGVSRGNGAALTVRCLIFRWGTRSRSSGGRRRSSTLGTGRCSL